MLLIMPLPPRAASHPSRGGWIEIMPVLLLLAADTGPTPHGVGGLKYLLSMPYCTTHFSPTPHGVGGLKYRKE